MSDRPALLLSRLLRQPRLLALTAMLLSLLPLCDARAGDAPAYVWDKAATPFFRHLTVPKDLPSPAMAITQDRSGFIWIGTQDGLARWDGYRAKIFRHVPGDPLSLPGNLVTSLIADSRGLLVASSTGIVARYDYVTEQFHPLPPTSSGTAVYAALAENDQGALWLGNANGLSYLAPDAQTWEVVELPHHQRVWSLVFSRSGTLWAATDHGLLRLDQGASGFTEVTADAPLASANIRSLTESSDGTLWFGTTDGRIGRLGPDGVFRQIETPPGLRAVSSLIEIEPGVIEAGTAGTGLLVFDATTGKTLHALKFDALRPTSLSEDYLLTLYKDHSGGLWAGHLQGVDYAPASTGAFQSLLPSDHEAPALSGAHAATIGPLESGKFLIGTENGGDLLSLSEGGLSVTHNWQKSGDKLPSAPIFAVATTDDGTTWIATGQGIYRYRNGALHLFKPLADSSARTLLAEGMVLWIGLDRGGLVRLDTTTSQMATYQHEDQDPQSLSDNFVLGLLRDPKNGLWIGTQHGLNLFDGVHFRHFFHDASVPDSIPSDTAITLRLDNQKRLWIGTHGGGIAILGSDLGSDAPHFRHLGRSDGLPNDNVGTLLTDKRGFIWVGTDYGFARIDPATLAIKSFSTAEGIPIPGNVVNSGLALADGTLLFGGLGGVTIIHPERVSDWTYVPEVARTSVRVNGKPHANEASITLAPQDDSLQVEFAALDYSDPENNRYSYKLEGFDRDWVATDANHRLAAYTNLPPGSYTLLLRGSNRSGIWADPPTRMPLTVLPAWYQTVWARLGLVLLLALGVAILVRSRTELLRRRQKELERQVAEQTAEIARLLHNSGEGFMSFGPDLVVDRQYSRACETFFGETPAGKNAAFLLFAENPRHASFLTESVSSAFTAADISKRELILSLLPKETDRRGRRLRIHYAILENGHLMVVLRDITTERRLAERVSSEHKRLGMIVAAVTDSRDFFDTVQSFRRFTGPEFGAYLRSQDNPIEGLRLLYRQIHTFKGEFTLLSFERLPATLHEVESRLENLHGAKTPPRWEDLQTALASFGLEPLLEQDLAVVRKALGDDFMSKGGQVSMTPDQAAHIKILAKRWRSGEAIDLSRPDIRVLLDEIDRVGTVSLKSELASYDQAIAQVALRLDKEVAPLAVEGDDVLMDPDVYGPFMRSLIHIFRNCVTHGIEAPDRRVEEGKDEFGQISCSVRRSGRELELVIADDGGGIDMTALRTQLVAANICEGSEAIAMRDEEIAPYIFHDRVSTIGAADQWAGRGMGLAAVTREVEALGGRISVESFPGQGTRFLIWLSLPDQQGLSLA